ncbi:tumor necrosis factor receptor superfamily member 4-like [Myxocyprinus asiaticus]|uniref:tumor necrosis factor receptor superfamily member 4-like n=1 Tax=Myxocyprinus asiaticus TaxID=70543 RepID=UPI0022217A5D|nr:tumor necrosis factor receptor superfamily member 4-like [Myxocyprinus asiaticus]XP_051568277.1 tumor necrosis factor receptor superfamily member 4-like [Myxocyprinus asiaticus]XP_051568278.1 tumor necrosis factor receptor superfamily member 4-like [Myxocyprinus asiaticus]
MFWHMEVLSALLCLLLPLLNASASTVCQPGQFRNYNTNKCEPCPVNQYSSKSGTDIYCDNCSTCKKGSTVVEECTQTKDTHCKCKSGFKPRDVLKEEICFCDKGDGLNDKGDKCEKCSNGHFTDKIDSICRKWKECKSGVKIPGSSTSDAVCNEPLDGVTEAPTTSSKSLLQTTTISSTTSSTTTTSPPQNRHNFYILCPVLICAGILLLTGLLCKWKVTHCIHNHKKEASRQESVCRKPVEESGEKCLSLLV